jgi:hypothetical protein
MRLQWDAGREGPIRAISELWLSFCRAIDGCSCTCIHHEVRLSIGKSWLNHRSSITRQWHACDVARSPFGAYLHGRDERIDRPRQCHRFRCSRRAPDERIPKLKITATQGCQIYHFSTQVPPGGLGYRYRSYHPLDWFD